MYVCEEIYYHNSIYTFFELRWGEFDVLIFQMNVFKNAVVFPPIYRF